MSFRTSIGLWPSLLPHPDRPPHFRFLFVRPAFCLQLPSAPPRGGHPCCSASTFPCRVCGGLSPHSRPTRHHCGSDSASHGATCHARRTKEKSALVALFRWRNRCGFAVCRFAPRNRLSTVTGKIFRIKKRPPPPDHCIPRSDDGTLLICKSACMHVLSDDDWPRRACRHSAAGTCFTCRQR